MPQEPSPTQAPVASFHGTPARGRAGFRRSLTRLLAASALVLPVMGVAPTVVQAAEGGPRFRPPHVLESVATVAKPLVRDLDADGNTDIAMVEGTPSDDDSGISVLRGDGSGTGFARKDYASPIGGNGGGALGAADFTSDGQTDLVAVGNATASVFAQIDRDFTPIGTTTLQGKFSKVTSVATGDWNSDGHQDVAGSQVGDSFGNLLILLGDGTGRLTQVANTPPAAMSNRIEAGDVDGDGDLDLVAGGIDFNGVSRGLVVFVNNGAGVFEPTSTPMPEQAQDLILRDVNGDRAPDVVIVSLYKVSLFLSSGSGFGAARYAASPKVIHNDPENTMYGMYQVALGDMNGDALLDLAVAHAVKRMHVFAGDGAGSFTSGADIALPEGFFYALSYGNLDGDSYGDLFLGGGASPDSRSPRSYVYRGLDPRAEVAPTLSLSPATISAGQATTVTYRGTPGSVVEILSRTQPSTAFTKIGSVTLDSSGSGSSTHKPQKNTRITARTGSGLASVDQPIIAVRSVASFRTERVGTRTYTFTGRVYPALDNRLVNIYRNGGLIAQARSDAAGIYKVTRTLSAGTFTFQPRTPDDQHNLGTSGPAQQVTIR